MSSHALTVRNASALRLTLDQFERFEALSSIPTSKSYLRSWITSKPESTATPSLIHSPDQLSTASSTFHVENVSLEIPPFRTLVTTISTLASQPLNTRVIANPNLRLTFTIAGQRYRLDISGTEDRSTLLIPLSANSNIDITAIHLPTSSFLVLLQSSAPGRWMSGLPDSLSLALMSIPGTHNSPAHHRAMPSVRCQAVSVRKQLDNGIRFLDIRLQPASATNLEDESLYLVHGAFSVTLIGYYHFRGLMDRVYAFLDQNPSETILISLKREGIGKASDNHLARILKRHYIDKNPTKWFIQPRIPKLGEARGKLVLLRRFNYDHEFATEYAPHGWGIDATSWADNSPFSLNPTGQLCIQDFYEVLAAVNIDEKITYVEEHLAKAAAASSGGPESNPSHLYINFASASNFWKTECWPEKIATRLNPAVLEYLCRVHMNIVHSKSQVEDQSISKGSTGVVVCDWVGNNGNWDLVKMILATNEAQRTSQAGAAP